MADKNGIMIWSEIPLWQHISFDKPEVYAKATRMLGEVIRRDRNKASVILWSVSNETSNNPVRTQFLTNLVDEARRLDPSPPITSALLGPRVVNNQLVQDDPLAAALDVVGQNEYIGWYVGHPEDADNITWKLPENPSSSQNSERKPSRGCTAARTSGGPKNRKRTSTSTSSSSSTKSDRYAA